MKNIYKKAACLLALGLTLASCDDYLNDVPKGAKSPETLADYEAFLRDEYNTRLDILGATHLLNDQFITAATLTSNRLYNANYMWDENADRIALKVSDESTYYTTYSGISAFNLIIENALSTTKATEQEQRIVWAQAKIMRAMNFFYVTNFYADTYVASTASTKLSVPLITSANINAPSKQVTIQEMYDFILMTLKKHYHICLRLLKPLCIQI